MNGKPYLCQRCDHVLYKHRESAEWRLLNPRRKQASGCTEPGCICQEAQILLQTRGDAMTDLTSRERRTARRKRQASAREDEVIRHLEWRLSRINYWHRRMVAHLNHLHGPTADPRVINRWHTAITRLSTKGYTVRAELVRHGVTL